MVLANQKLLGLSPVSLQSILFFISSLRVHFLILQQSPRGIHKYAPMVLLLVYSITSTGSWSFPKMTTHLYGNELGRLYTICDSAGPPPKMLFMNKFGFLGPIKIPRSSPLHYRCGMRVMTFFGCFVVLLAFL